MKFIFKLASYLFHPLWMPFAGALFYFFMSPRFFPASVVQAKLVAIAIMSLFIPIVFYFMLKTLGMANSYFLEDVKERKWPLLLYAALNLIILRYVLDVFDYQALYYYFTGIFASSLIALTLVLFGKKVSLHMVGLTGLTTFIIGFSLHFSINLLEIISLLLILTGLTASSRLYFKAHSGTELILGILVGVLPQAFFYFLWL